MTMNIMLDSFCDKNSIPYHAYNSDAGYDLRTPKGFCIPGQSFVTIDTGVHLEIPEGYFAKIEGKSGLMINHGIATIGGVIDSGFTGTIKIGMYNFSYDLYYFEKGDRICQFVLIPILKDEINFNLVDSFKPSDRGDNGYGSSGRK